MSEHVPHGTSLSAEVAIAGSGPAGLTLAECLAERGIRVLLIESGEIRHSRKANDHLRGKSAGYPFPMIASRQRAFGGTSSHWTAETGLRLRPLDPVDFESRPGVRDTGWPITHHELKPYVLKASDSVGVRPAFEATAESAAAQPALSWEGGPELPRFRFADHRTFVDRLERVRASRHINLITGGTVVGIAMEEDTVAGWTVACRNGGTFSVTARHYVLACGGIDNARTLLAADPGGRGIGNENDNVGRYLMEHVSIDSGVIVPSGREKLDVSAFQDQRDAWGKHQIMLSVGERAIREHGLLNAAFWVNELDARFVMPSVQSARALKAGRITQPRPLNSAKHLMNVATGAAGLAQFMATRARRTPPARSVISLRIMAEQLPNRRSRVTLAPGTDSVGMRRARVDWRLSTTDVEMIRRHQDVLSSLLIERGTGRVEGRLGDETPAATLIANYHHMGTTRMHHDPKQGVVDADCKVHSTTNLHIAGSSVFPTGGYANPTLTIIALAIRLGDRLAALLRPTATTVP